MTTKANYELVGGTVEVKKENVLERLNKRNKERQNYLDVKLEQRNKENLQLEGADYFAQTFAERAHEIETHLEHVGDAATNPNTVVGGKRSPSEPVAVNGGPPNTNELIRRFADITMEIQELQRYLTSSTMFLTDFKIKACQTVLNELSTNCEEMRTKLMPKKKFGFSGKKVAPKPVVNPKVGATASADKLDTPEKYLSSNPARTNFTWTLSNRSGEYIRLLGEEVNGKDVTISNLSNCFVELQGHAGSVQISNAVDCIFLCGPIARSLFAEHLSGSTLAVACQQLRLHSSSACRIYLHVTCRAIIEDCKQIEVGAYSYDYSTLEEDFQKAGIDKAHNNYTDVADFNWLSPDVHSPNWTLLKDYPTPNWCEMREKFKMEKSITADL